MIDNNSKEFDQVFDDVFKEEAAEINKQLSKKIMIALVGDVN